MEVLRYPAGTKLAGVVFVQRLTSNNPKALGLSLYRSIEALKELCGDTTLKNVVIMTHCWDTDKPEAEQGLNLDLCPGACFHPAINQGAQVHHCSRAYNPDLGALRIILRGSQAKRYKKPEESMLEVMNKEVEELRRELEEQKRRAQQEACVLKKRIAEMESKLEEQERRARDNAGGLWNCIVMMQSELEERSGKASATYLNSQHVPSRPI